MQLIAWDEGVGHFAGNSDGKTIRRFPVATKVSRSTSVVSKCGALMASCPCSDRCAVSGGVPGFALNRANEACGVRNAAFASPLRRTGYGTGRQVR